jgi:sodium/potassium/calcium exchanger 6
MYIVSSEIVAVLQALGVILNLSDGIMGLTVFAFGNSVGDFFTNIMLAKMGYYTMALSASWGAPMISMCV